MLAGVYNIECDQGSTFTRTFTLDYQDAVDKTVWHPWDLAGYIARMQVRSDPYAASTLLDLSMEDGYLTLEDNKIHLYLPAEVTADVERSGVYDIEIVSPSGEVHKPVKGTFKLNLEVTK